VCAAAPAADDSDADDDDADDADDADAADVDWRSMPSDLLRSCFVRLAGDTLALCAAAGVCTSWRAAALSAPAAWRQLRLSNVRRSGSIGDAVVARLAARAGAELTLVALPSGANVTDACLAHFAPAVAPRLAVLRLAGCENVTAQGVASALAGARLERLTLAGTAPLRVTAAQVAADEYDEDAVLHPLRELTRLYHDDDERKGNDSDDDDDDDDSDAGLDVNAVCTHPGYRPWGGQQALCCGMLFDAESDEALPCDWCMGASCARHDKVTCAKCGHVVCGGCLEEALGGSGFNCSGCRKMMCDECAEEHEEATQCITHVACSLCSKQWCFECECNPRRGHACGLVCDNAFGAPEG
jgi:hypothetical protein